MNTAEQFAGFYRSELRQAVRLPGRILSQYSVTACLSSGDRKEVCLLTDRTTGRQVILRRLPSGLGETNRAEYEMLQKLDHPRIPKAIAVFEEEGFCWFLRSYVQGESLHQRVAARGPASEREAARILGQLCDLLTYLHTQSPPVIHRDIKPQNVILDPDGAVHLIDFDIARRYDPAADKDTAAMGTAATAPPEQYGYGQTDARSDLYSLGILLIFLCTGRYERAALAKLPPRLRKIADTCTRFSPRDRYPSAARLKKALFAPRRPLLPGLVAGLALLCIAAGVIYTGQRAGNSPPPALSLPSGIPLGAVLAPSGEPTGGTAVAEDGTVTFASGVIEELVRQKLGKAPGEPVKLSELQTISQLSVVGVPSENRTPALDFRQDRAYQNGEPVTRGEIGTLTDLSLMKGLRNLVLAYQRIEDLAPLRELRLEYLTLMGNFITDITPLSEMTTLRELDLSNNPVEDITPLEKLQNLEALQIRQCNVTDLSVLAGLKELTFLNMAGTHCKDHSPLLSLTRLRYLDISETAALDLGSAAGNPNLRELFALHCGITDLSELGRMPELERLNVSNNEITGLAGIERYPNLKSLAIRYTRVGDLSPLADLTELEELDLRGVDADLAPLMRIPSLKRVICSPDLQARADRIGGEAAFAVQVMETP